MAKIIWKIRFALRMRRYTGEPFVRCYEYAGLTSKDGEGNGYSAVYYPYPSEEGKR